MAGTQSWMAGVASSAPARKVAAVTKHDDNDIATGVADALFIGVGGDVSLIAGDDSTAVLFKNVASGQILPVSAKRVRVTGSTATDIVALYR